MKLNFRLDLNTIVLLLLIVVFSVILYYNFKRDRVIEGMSAFDSKKTEYTDINKKINLYKTNQTLYVATWSDYNRNKDLLTRTRADYNPLVSKIAINNSSRTGNLFPNSNDVKYKIDDLIRIIDTKISEINTIQSTYQDITDFITIGVMSTQANFNSNNTKINNKINELQTNMDRVKSEIIRMLGFTVGPVVAGDGNATLTINASPNAIANTYTINALYAENKNIQKILPSNFTNPYVFAGLTNDTPYTFSVTADYGILSDGTKLSNTTTSVAITPRTKPSFTVTMGTGSASVNIIPTTGNPTYTVMVTSSTGQTITQTVNTANNTSISGLTNGIKHDFKVIAKYGNDTIIESDVKTGIPRGSPILSVNESDGAAILTIGEPDGADKPISYKINTNPPAVPENTISDISNPIRLKGLINGITYTFSVVANYNDGTKSSPATISATPKLRPTARIRATAGNASASIIITPPTGNSSTSILNYVVTSNPASTPPTRTISASGTKTFTIGGLRNGTSYKFRVVVNYTDGTSSASTESSPVTPVSSVTRTLPTGTSRQRTSRPRRR
jgi:hypothetical protein